MTPIIGCTVIAAGIVGVAIGYTARNWISSHLWQQRAKKEEGATWPPNPPRESLKGRKATPDETKEKSKTATSHSTKASQVATKSHKGTSRTGTVGPRPFEETKQKSAPAKPKSPHPKRSPFQPSKKQPPHKSRKQPLEEHVFFEEVVFQHPTKSEKGPKTHAVPPPHEPIAPAPRQWLPGESSPKGQEAMEKKKHTAGVKETQQRQIAEQAEKQRLITAFMAGGNIFNREDPTSNAIAIRILLEKRGEIARELPPGATQSALEKAVSIAQTAHTMEDDLCTQTFIAGICFHRMELYHRGFSAALPQHLSYRSSEARERGILVDSTGKAFDSMREGRPSITDRIQEYIVSNGGNYEAIDSWAYWHAAQSWHPKSFQGRLFSLKERHQDPSAVLGDYFCGLHAQSFGAYVKRNEPDARDWEAWVMFRACQIEMLSQMDLPGKTRDGCILAYRTETEVALKSADLLRHIPEGSFPAEKTRHARRGPLESLSVGDPVCAKGVYAVAYKVPIHRIGGFYGLRGNPSLRGPKACFFDTDHQKEIVANLTGLSFEYVEQVSNGIPIAAQDYLDKKAREIEKRAGVIL